MLKEANENKFEIFLKIRNIYIKTNCLNNLMEIYCDIKLLTFISLCIYYHILIADLTLMHESTLNTLNFWIKMFSKGVIWLFHLMFANIFSFHAFWSLSIKTIEALKLCIYSSAQQSVILLLYQTSVPIIKCIEMKQCEGY